MSVQNHWAVGNLVRVAGVIKDASQVLIDPTTVRFKFKRPDTGAVTSYLYLTDAQVVRDSQGNYHVDVSADAAGEWPYRYESTGTGQAAQEGSFFADATRVA